MQTKTRERVASLISNILNPFWVSLATILLLSFYSTSSPLDAIRWTLISAAVSILPVFAVIVYLIRNGKLDAAFANGRAQRTRIYLVASLCGLAGCIVLAYLRAPPLLMAAFISGLATMVIFMCINLWWKISLHTALVTASATVLLILYGWIALLSVALIPLTAWARMELKIHSLPQTAIGALLAALIVYAAFYPFVLA